MLAGFPNANGVFDELTAGAAKLNGDEVGALVAGCAGLPNENGALVDALAPVDI